MSNSESGDPRSYEDLRLELEQLRQKVAEMEALEAERQEAVNALRESEEKYRILLDESSDPIFAFYPDGQYRYVNRAFADGVGRRLEEIIHKKIWDVFPKDEADKRYAVVKWVFENAQSKVIEVRVPRPDGDRYYITTAKPVLGERGEVLSVICISKEITERKQMEQKLLLFSTHDILTGLYNRNYYELELERLQREGQFPISIVIADVDQLKSINDRWGHAAGDEVIRLAADSLRHAFRAEDVVARIGGDEFAVLLMGTSEAVAVERVLNLRSRLDEFKEKRLQMSIGLTTGEEGCSLVEVMRQADDRMYQEKDRHRREAAQG
ncbi:MAG TPA: sensor domain-containing diguanylate cyclase [Anaerolineaceae bacterium]|nr:sensor domain-containing diguanylate cyclase [Anaerolineaceae bacterium]HPN53308.1 sensor domain-containing diguanylate cyclase [Anaerolineaceae bacterium]